MPTKPVSDIERVENALNRFLSSMGKGSREQKTARRYLSDVIADVTCPHNREGNEHDHVSCRARMWEAGNK